MTAFSRAAVGAALSALVLLSGGDARAGEPDAGAGLRREYLEGLRRYSLEREGAPSAAAAGELLAEMTESGEDAEWVAGALDFLAGALEETPPSIPEPPARRDLLRLLDYPLLLGQIPPDGGDGRASRRAGEAGRFFSQKARWVAGEAADADPAEALVVWKIYNMGFIVKSAGKTVGFDVHPGNVSAEHLLGSEALDALARHLDAAFVSHGHPDHLSPAFVAAMARAGRPVVMPESVRDEMAAALEAAGPGERFDPGRIVTARKGAVSMLEAGGVTAWSIPGRQGADVDCTLFAVRLGRWTVLHNGDNTAVDAYDEAARLSKVDLLLVNAGSGLPEAVALLRPGLFIPGHEHELSHLPGERVTYRRIYEEIDAVADPPPFAVLRWGEQLRWDGAPGRD